MTAWQPRPDTPGLWWACAPGGVPEVFLVDRRGGEWVAVGIDYEDTFPLDLFEGSSSGCRSMCRRGRSEG